MSALTNDLRFGFRILLKYPVFTLVAATALTVGVGANITLFGFVNALVLRPIAGLEPERLIRADSGEATLMNPIDYGDYLDYRDRNQSLSSLAAFYPGWMTPVRIDGPPEMIAVTPVSGNYFQTLGVSAAQGRVLTPEDDTPGSPDVIVLSDEGFRRYFGADPTALGRTITINGKPASVVGVLPAGFQGTAFPNLPQIYATFAARGAAGNQRTFLIGRLLPGVSRDEAHADLSRIAVQITAERGRRASFQVHPGTAAMPQLVMAMASLGVLFLVVAAAVLWVACNNIAVLLQARVESRRREMGIRLAIGASRPQVLRQILVESLLLASVGGLGAVGFALLLSRWLTHIYLPVPMPIALVFDFDWRVAAFAIGTSLAATAMFGLGPAMQSLRTDVVSALKQGSATTGRSRVISGLVVTQVAVSTALLVTSGLLVGSLKSPQERRFSSDGALMAVVRLSGSEYTPERTIAFIEDVIDRLERVSGILSVTAADSVPLTNNLGPLSPIDVRPETEDAPFEEESLRRQVYTNRVSRGHFVTLGIPLLQGRDFTRGDDVDSPPVGIANETLARRFWPGASPVGKVLRSADGERIEVVGLAADSKYETPDEEPKAFLYRPLTQKPIATASFLVKTNLSAERAASVVREQVASIDPTQAVYNLVTLDERLDLALLPNRALGTVSGVLGLFGLLLSAIGTYGILSFLVELRRREIGVRMALGATPSGVVSMTTRSGMKWTASGALLGLVGALTCTRLLQSFLRGITITAPPPILAVLLLVFATAYVACWIPARRASRTDPLAALRE